MYIIIGGSHQGKREYALARTGADEREVFDGETDAPAALSDTRILHHTHALICRMHREGRSEQEILSFLKDFGTRSGTVLICDEVGCGIVPLERSAREDRELVGRIMCELTKHADRVDRVVMGIAQRIK